MVHIKYHSFIRRKARKILGELPRESVMAIYPQTIVQKRQSSQLIPIRAFLIRSKYMQCYCEEVSFHPRRSNMKLRSNCEFRLSNNRQTQPDSRPESFATWCRYARRYLNLVRPQKRLQIPDFDMMMISSWSVRITGAGPSITQQRPILS
jgi:hypothetical protein